MGVQWVCSGCAVGVQWVCSVCRLASVDYTAMIIIRSGTVVRVGVDYGGGVILEGGGSSG